MTHPHDEQTTAQRDSGADRGSYRGGSHVDSSGRRKLFDLTINLPSLIMLVTMSVTSVGFIFGVYNSLDKRIIELEASDRQQELHFSRLESAQSDSKAEIKQSVEKLGDKVDKLIDRLSYSSAGNRPETRPWTRN